MYVKYADLRVTAIPGGDTFPALTVNGNWGAHPTGLKMKIVIDRV
jgi:hypothetical protein